MTSRGQPDRARHSDVGGTVILLAPDCTDARVIKRAKSFAAHGFPVAGFTFRRLRYNRDYVPEWENHDLGTIRDRAYGRRLLHLGNALRILLRRRDVLRNAAFVHAINLDLALLAAVLLRAFRMDTPLLYEVGDIQPVICSNGPVGRLMRRAERMVLARSRLLVVTSPGFIDNYFIPRQQFRGRWFLLENKLNPPVPKPIRSSRDGDLSPVRIGWFGTMRDARSWGIIKKLAIALPDRVEFHLRGRPMRLDPEDFRRTVDASPNIHYGGEYAHPDALAEMYSGIDVAWGIELQFEDLQSKWLLPNRVYESGYYGVPLVAARGSETGRFIEDLGIGWTVGPDFERDLTSLLNDLTRVEYARVRGRFDDIPPERFMSDDQFSEMCRLAISQDIG